MEQITFNPSNEPYYSEDFIKGFKCGAKRQFEADKKARQQGEWIEVTNGRGGHECSKCHDYAPSFQSGEEHLSHFCPNCGVDMRERMNWRKLMETASL